MFDALAKCLGMPLHITSRSFCYGFLESSLYGTLLIAITQSRGAEQLAALFCAGDSFSKQALEDILPVQFGLSASFVYQPQQVELFMMQPWSVDTLPIYLSDTPFRETVWNALLSIPYGTVISYSDLARYMHRPTAVRAVASAVGHNPISILIPCHRVLRQGGSMGGYRWGLSLKKSILTQERRVLLHTDSATPPRAVQQLLGLVR